MHCRVSDTATQPLITENRPVKNSRAVPPGGRKYQFSTPWRQKIISAQVLTLQVILLIITKYGILEVQKKYKHITHCWTRAFTCLLNSLK